MARITGLKVQPAGVSVQKTGFALQPKVSVPAVFANKGMTAKKTKLIVLGTGIALVSGMILVVLTRRNKQF